METAIRIEDLSQIGTKNICYWYENNKWWIYFPKCGIGNLSNHTVVENSDKTITVTPSILVQGHNKGTAIFRHGYLTNGIWKEC